MKILFITQDYLAPNESRSTALVRNLAPRHECTVLTWRETGEAAHSNETGVQIYRAPKLLRRFAGSAKLVGMLTLPASGVLTGSQLARRQPFDVINSQGLFPSGIVGQCIARLYGLPHIMSLGGQDLYDAQNPLSPHCRGPLKAAARYLLSNADILVSHADANLRHMRDIYGVNRTIDTVAEEGELRTARYADIFERAIDPTAHFDERRWTRDTNEKKRLKNVINS